MGVFLAMFDLLMAMAHENLEMLRRLEPQWKQDYDDYNRAVQKKHVGESARLLEARKMLYGMLKSFRVFEAPHRN
ncbi:MAG: hypothetical protein ACSLEN_14270 [Candidatus Malihini olakiniferum]